MKQSLRLTTSQQLTLTPQLKQSLKLLQLSTIDLEHEIQQQLESNPLLERDESAIEIDKDTSSADEHSSLPDIPQPISEASDPSYEIERTDDLAAEQDLTGNWEQAFEPALTSNIKTSTASSQTATKPEISQFVSKQESLLEHLQWQIQMSFLTERDKQIADAILYCLDDDGYLTLDIVGIVALFDPELMVDEAEVNAVLSLIKTLDPIGAGCKDLTERLLLLLDQLPTDTTHLELAKNIVSHHLPLLAKHDTANLKKQLRVDDHTLASCLALITGLNPRIGNEFKDDYADYIVADVLVKKINDTWVANLNAEHQTKLCINPVYANMLTSSIDEEGSDYIQQNLQQAKIFIKGLMSRYDTLLLVSQTIVERQQAFFEHGPEHMQPMVLQDIAQQLDLHESTISRATSGKYLLSPRGLVELKYFFSSAVSKSNGANSSSIAIRSLIKKMVDDESKQKPLSDSKLAKLLEEQGHIVARRTVAKYRESMQIAPSSQRKSLT